MIGICENCGAAIVIPSFMRTELRIVKEREMNLWKVIKGLEELIKYGCFWYDTGQQEYHLVFNDVNLTLSKHGGDCLKLMQAIQGV